MLSAITSEGPIAAQVFEEAVVADHVLTFLEKRLFPFMNPFPESNSVMILDNARVHQKEEIRELAATFGILVEFLPPYSPGNPFFVAFQAKRLTKSCRLTDLPPLPRFESH